MGHVATPAYPKGARWKEVVGLVGLGADIPQLAAATVRAADDGFRLAALDPALRHAVWLFARLPRAARFDDFAAALRGIGLAVPEPPSLFALVKAVSDRVDAQRPRTDLSELAHAAAGEVLTEALGEAAENLFGVTPDEVQRATAGFDTAALFGGLARRLFARFTAKHLNFYLEREVGRNLGGSKRFPNVASHGAFRQAIGDHCHLAAGVVEEIAADWYSSQQHKTNGNVTPESANWLVTHAMEKLGKVLAQEVAA